MDIENKLAAMGLTLPAPPAPAGSYVPMVEVGGFVWLSGAICMLDGCMTHTGFVGEDLDLEQGREAARVCALNLVAVLKQGIGDLDRVQRVVSLNGYVLAREGFADSPAVINGASDLLRELFGARGGHSRAAVAVSGLPRHSSVEIQAVFAVDSGPGS